MSTAQPRGVTACSKSPAEEVQFARGPVGRRVEEPGLVVVEIRQPLQTPGRSEVGRYEYGEGSNGQSGEARHG